MGKNDRNEKPKGFKWFEKAREILVLIPLFITVLVQIFQNLPILENIGSLIISLLAGLFISLLL